MQYNIKAIPTTYAGVKFRSRLEARWAAFFDLCGWKWDYEPFDLDGWAPDFLLLLPIAKMLAEVKPFDFVSLMEEQVACGGSDHLRIADYEKASKHGKIRQVVLLGASPPFNGLQFPPVIPVNPPLSANYSLNDLIDALYVDDMEAKWREAGNIVQWHPDNANSRRRSAA